MAGRRSRISAPFVGGCFFDLSEEDEPDDGGAQENAHVLELARFGIEGVIIDLDF